MNKLQNSFLERCSLENCCDNELLVMPSKGDTGYEEYILHKTGLIRKKKNVFSPLEQNVLMLSYPDKGSLSGVFERFYESPAVVAENHVFEGCFAIDITSYINHTDCPEFQRLLSYIDMNPSAVYVLMVCCDNVKECDNLYKALLHNGGFRRTDLSLPSPRALAEYILNMIRSFCLHIEQEESQSYLEELFRKKPCGYDFAEYFVNVLKTNDYKGDAETLKKMADELILSAWVNTSAIGY